MRSPAPPSEPPSTQHPAPLAVRRAPAGSLCFASLPAGALFCTKAALPPLPSPCPAVSTSPFSVKPLIIFLKKL